MDGLLDFSEHDNYFINIDDDFEPYGANEELVYDIERLENLFSNNVEHLSSHFR